MKPIRMEASQSSSSSPALGNPAAPQAGQVTMSREDKAREETLQKLHQLEMEYVALQKAYALLQQQMELGHEAEEHKMKISIAAEPPDTSGQKEISGIEPKASETQENIEDKGDLVKCPGSPVPVYMETDESIKEEVILVLDTVTPSEQAGVLQNPGSENVSSRKPQDSPVSFMECSSEEGFLVKKDRLVEMEEMDLRVKGTLQSGATPVKTTEVEGGVHQPDGSTLTLKEVSQSSEAERAPVLAMFPSEVEMMEDVKQSEQLAEAKEEKSEGSQARDAPVSEEKSMGSTPGTAYMSPLLVEEVASTVIENSLPLPSKVIPLIPTQAGSQEVSVPKIILDAELPGATSSEILALSDPNQSVATLLRDVKKALESGMANDVEFPSNSSSSSALSPQVMSSPEEYFEVESMLLLSPDEDKCGSQDPVIPKAEDTPLKPKQLFYAVEQDTDVPDVSSPPERRQDEIVQDDTSKEQGKQDHSLVASLKNSLLMLLHMKTADVVEHKLDAKHGIKKGDAQSGFPEEVCSPEGSLSPPTSRKMYESAKDNDSSQSAESMHSSSTSGKMTPASEEDMGQNVESLQTSPTIPRKTMEYSKKDLIPQVESPPLSPATSRKSAKAILEKTFLSKEDLRFSPTTSRKIDAKIGATTDYPRALSVPSIVVGSLPMEKSLGNMLFDSHPDSDRKWKSTENLSLIPSATPQELASGARRKIFLPKNKQLDDAESGSAGSLSPPSKKDSPNVSPGLSRRGNVLLSSQSPPAERRSPGMARRLAMLEVPKLCEETTDKGTALEVSSVQTKDSDVSSKEEVQAVEPRKVNDPYKAPQVIRKIRAELFSDASGNLKLWCQFFNILSDSDITWHKDEVQVAKVKRCSGDEGQVSLAIVQASKKDCGVYQCTIQNDYGTDSTDVLLSAEILSGFISKEDVEVGEEIEMTPMVFAKGLADSGYWGDKFFGRIVMEEAHVGAGFRRKSCRVKVIYGLEPMFESGKTCIIKIRNLITFGTKNESTLVEKNYEITIQECKIQNTTREYCKIFAAESRVVSNFGQLPEILPLNLIYRPANNIPYATIEEDLQGQFEKYCISDRAGKLHMKNTSEIEQKCCTFQHWVYQWTNGNFLVANLEGVGWKLTNIGIATKSKGYQGLKESCYPALLCEFPLVHQCNSYCEMLGLKSLKATEGLQPPSKPKGSKSPSIGRKAGSAQSSPQLQKKGLASPQSARKGGVSPKATRKATETGDAQSTTKNKGNDVSKLAKSQ